MASRRMFSLEIVDSDAFLDMPLSSQSLYFHLSMRADDDGFIDNSKRIMRMVGSSDDDMKLLFAKNFVIPFDDGICVIKHWRIHNYIRGDRKKQTNYIEQFKKLGIKKNGAYTLSGGKQIELTEKKKKDKNQEYRQKVFSQSDLPESFNYKIRNAFIGEPCPVCNELMQPYKDESGIIIETQMPSIQHNKPIAKGGKHELDNISVICHHCNISIRDTETSDLNNNLVVEKWKEINNVSQMSVKSQSNVGIGKVRLGKGSIGKSNILSGKPNDMRSVIYKDTVDYLNHKAGTQYKHSSKKTRSLIDARTNDGFTLEDFKTVIDNKTKEWLNTEMAKYLRPETLFGTKFESYLNQKTKKQDSGIEWFDDYVKGKENA